MSTNPIDVQGRDEQPVQTRSYQALLFRGVTDRTLGPWRAMFIATEDGLPSERSLIGLDNAWYMLVHQHNLLLDRRRAEDLITVENWRDHALLLTPTEWFKTDAHRKRREVCPDAFTHQPYVLDPDLLDRWQIHANRR